MDQDGKGQHLCYTGTLFELRIKMLVSILEFRKASHRETLRTPVKEVT